VFRTNSTVASKPRYWRYRRRWQSNARFWWASTVTGIAAAVAVIAIMNWRAPEQPVADVPLNIVAAVPAIDLKAEAAVLTNPLQEELDKLESDLKKAEEKVRRDIGL
jgi:hypothetical protein